LYDENQHLFIPTRHGLEMFEYDLACIKQAEQFIEMSPCFMGGKILDRLLDAFEERLENSSELEVFLMGSPMLLLNKDHKRLQHLLNKYKGRFHLEYTESIPNIFPEYCPTDNHIKCLIVDEKYFSIGGTNFDEALCTEGTYTPEPRGDTTPARGHLPSGMRDYDIVGKGPIAKELRIHFYKHYALWKHFNESKEFIKDPEFFANQNAYCSINKDKPQAHVDLIDFSEKKVIANDVKLIISGPQDDQNKITSEYVRLISLAKKEIVIGNLYSNPAIPILEVLKKAVTHHLSLTFITNGFYPDSPFFSQFIYMANRIHYVPLFYGRDYSTFESLFFSDRPYDCQIFEYHVPGIIYHKKTMVIDKRYTVIGSYNLGTKSDGYDYESIIVIDSEEIAKQTLDVIEEDKKYCEKISPKQARDWYFDPFLSYLAAVQKQFHGFL
jgi:phosphatidylserine/phosphatidylglycerophosphate/cardiolipin synthase-like enzyme